MADVLQILAPADIGLDGDRLTALSLDVAYDVIERTLVAGREHEPAPRRAASHAVASPMPLEAPVMTIVWSCKGFRETAMAVLSFFKRKACPAKRCRACDVPASGWAAVQSGEELEPVAVRLREHRLDRVCCMIGNLLRDGGKQRVGLLRQAGWVRSCWGAASGSQSCAATIAVSCAACAAAAASAPMCEKSNVALAKVAAGALAAAGGAIAVNVAG